MTKKKLGKGLDALLSRPTKETADGALVEERNVPQNAVKAIAEIAVVDIKPSPFQPRRTFAAEALEELATSIQQHGVLQPIVVRRLPQGGFELIAGERRWRAAQQAGLQTIPVVQRDVSDREASAFALIENIQRENLNVVEEALGLSRLRSEFDLTQQELADVVGKSRAAIANSLRLLNLGSIARDLLMEGKLDMGHARALLGLAGTEQDLIAQDVAAKKLSVRQTEALVRKLSAVSTKQEERGRDKDGDTVLLERRLSDYLGANVHITQRAQGRGELVIKYGSLDELDGVLQRLHLPA
ncbi:MAG: ParB/RepB/Spo0J family partition protein [Candidatus Azotimanducaceae bacterium]|jgi:ParB family chromosome partitioning protein|tara:strand:- start:274 stop:1170 length:897 start_codon:yes stop_codon:yes gene_type:complete